jgi:hypothetical protein
MTVLLFAMPALHCFGQGHQGMQPGVNFRVTDKNVEQPVVVKDAGPPAGLRTRVNGIYELRQR